ncbi:TPA: putative ABC transporter permease [bacterium]|jgi:uncharacterized membrane protein|nr:putative ABC transporter permease [bacterium]
MSNSKNTTSIINEDVQMITHNSMITKVQEETTNNEVFAKGMCYSKLFWLFIIGCVIGTYYEQILTLFREGSWESRRGVIYGPFNPVYGFGMILIIVLLYKVVSWWKLLIIGGLLGGGFEYLLSYLQELFIQSRSWDYSNHFLNLNGRTTIPFMIFWGLLATIVIKYVYPFLNSMIEKVPIKLGKLMTVIFSIFMLFNLVLTGVVLLRQAQRHKNIKPYTFVGELIDEYYTDEYLSEVFPNMTK